VLKLLAISTIAATHMWRRSILRFIIALTLPALAFFCLLLLSSHCLLFQRSAPGHNCSSDADTQALGQEYLQGRMRMRANPKGKATGNAQEKKVFYRWQSNTDLTVPSAKAACMITHTDSVFQRWPQDARGIRNMISLAHQTAHVVKAMSCMTVANLPYCQLNCGM
jgi:hypothetical protein